jgi:hypothetical protein
MIAQSHIDENLPERHAVVGATVGRWLFCPLLVSVCDEDAIATPTPAAKVAEAAPGGELRRYPIGHFDVFADPWLSAVTAVQTEFLRRVLSPSTERTNP